MSEDHDDIELWVTVKQFSTITGKSVFTLRCWCRDGKVPARKDHGGRDWLVGIKKRRTRTLRSE